MFALLIVSNVFVDKHVKITWDKQLRNPKRKKINEVFHLYFCPVISPTMIFFMKWHSCTINFWNLTLLSETVFAVTLSKLMSVLSSGFLSLQLDLHFKIRNNVIKGICATLLDTVLPTFFSLIFLLSIQVTLTWKKKTVKAFCRLHGALASRASMNYNQP